MSTPAKTPSLPVDASQISCVAGLDTAASRFHLWRNDGASWSCVITDKKMGADDRRQYLFQQARLVFALQPAGMLVVCEEPIQVMNGKTTRLLSMAAGAIWAAHLECNFYWFWAEINSWKLKVVGKGNANKEEIADWARQNMGLDWTDPADADFWDAACLARYGEILTGLWPHA